VTSESETVDMTRKVRIPICGLKINGELEGLVVLLDEAEIGIPVLVLGEDYGIAFVFCELKDLWKKMNLQYL